MLVIDSHHTNCVLSHLCSVIFKSHCTISQTWTGEEIVYRANANFNVRVSLFKKLFNKLVNIINGWIGQRGFTPSVSIYGLILGLNIQIEFKEPLYGARWNLFFWITFPFTNKFNSEAFIIYKSMIISTSITSDFCIFIFEPLMEGRNH